ncbi:MAG: DUF177 domain-containing protein [Chitinophagales bacterium]|nr:DUF177 domain-containing protein [Chitinophagales bacterium]
MNRLEKYTIPYVGLKNGKHFFNYHLNEEFFKLNEDPMIQKGDVDVKVVFDKSNTPYILDFELHGVIHTECDRCISEIDLPIQSTHRIYVKFDKDADELVDEDLEIIFIKPDEPEIDITEYLYDFALLSVPYSKHCEDVGKSCDPNVIKYLNTSLEDKIIDETIDPRWEKLNKLKSKNN